MSTSDNTLQEQTIIHDPRAMAPASRFLYNPNLNKSLRYKGFGGYLVERDPLRQWGQAQFRMVLTNRWPRSASTWLPLSKLPQRPALPPFAHPAAATGSPSRRANGQHRGRSRAGPIAGQDKPAVTIKARVELTPRGRVRFGQSLFKIQNVWYILSHSPEKPRAPVEALTGDMEWLGATEDVG